MYIIISIEVGTLVFFTLSRRQGKFISEILYSTIVKVQHGKTLEKKVKVRQTKRANSSYPKVRKINQLIQDI